MNEEEFSDFWQLLVEKRYSASQKDLTKNERIFYAVNVLRGSVPRSGFIGYFENTNADIILEAKTGLKKLNLNQCLLTFEKALTLVFGDKPIPNIPQQIGVIPASCSEEEYEKMSDVLDEAIGPIEKEFYEYDKIIFEALCKFAEENNLLKNC